MERLVENEKAKSGIWIFFLMKEVAGKLQTGVAVCRECRETVKSCGNTSNLMQHLRRRHPCSPALHSVKAACGREGRSEEPEQKDVDQVCVESVDVDFH